MGADADQAVLYIVGAIFVLAGGGVCFWASRSLAQKGPERQKQLLKLIAGIAIAVSGVVLMIGFGDGSRPLTVEEKLQQQAVEINKTLPKMLDENTRFDVVRVAGRDINYEHTVVSHSSTELDSVVYRYNYFANDGVLVSSVLIAKETCGLR